MYHWALLQQCVLKVCRQSTIFNDLSIIVFILKIGSVLGRILPYFSSSQSHSTLLYSLLFSKSKPTLYLDSAVWQSQNLVPLKVTNSTGGECLSLTSSPAGSEKLVLNLWFAWSSGGFRLVEPSLDEFWEFPAWLQSSTNLQFATQTLLSCQISQISQISDEMRAMIESLAGWVAVMVAGPLPEPHITKQCWSVACKAAHPSPLLSASHCSWRQHRADDLPQPERTNLPGHLTPHTYIILQCITLTGRSVILLFLSNIPSKYLTISSRKQAGPGLAGRPHPAGRPLPRMYQPEVQCFGYST